MELTTRRGSGGAHLMALIIQQPIFSPSRSGDSNSRHRSRPKSLFYRKETNSPTCSEPTSPKVNCAGRVMARAVMKAPTESKGDKKSTLVKLLTSSLRGYLLVEGVIRCCQSPRDLVTRESDEEEEEEGEEERCNLARWFMMAELAGKEGIEGVMQDKEVEKVEKGSILAPLNALQLMKQRSASTRIGEGERVG